MCYLKQAELNIGTKFMTRGSLEVNANAFVWINDSFICGKSFFQVTNQSIIGKLEVLQISFVHNFHRNFHFENVVGVPRSQVRQEMYSYLNKNDVFSKNSQLGHLNCA